MLSEDIKKELVKLLVGTEYNTYYSNGGICKNVINLSYKNGINTRHIDYTSNNKNISIYIYDRNYPLFNIKISTKQGEPYHYGGYYWTIKDIIVDNFTKEELEKIITDHSACHQKLLDQKNRRLEQAKEMFKYIMEKYGVNEWEARYIVKAMDMNYYDIIKDIVKEDK